MRWLAILGWVFAALFALLWVASGPCGGPVLRDPEADLLRDRVADLEADLAAQRGEPAPEDATGHPPLVRPPVEENQPATPARFTVRVVSARGLPVRDRLGTADPFVVAAYDGEERISAVKRGTVSPVWGQTFEFRFAKGASLTFIVYDRDVMRHDLIGRATLALEPGVSGKRDLSLSAGGTLTVEIRFPD
ncbi:MAG: C2 domain-containing protein [Planctomycetota bacterium]|jgi:hypothetical protein